MTEDLKALTSEIQELIEKATIDLQDYSIAERLNKIQDSLIEFCDCEADGDAIAYIVRAAKIEAAAARRRIADITDLVDSYLAQYHPALSLSDCDEFVTSDELMNMFSAVTNVSRNTVFALMKQRGCKIIPLDGRFVWLLKEATLVR